MTERRYASEACPYCTVRLDPLPKAKKRCLACGQSIYVRSGPDGMTYLLQEVDLPILEEAWGEYRARQEYKEKVAAAGLDFDALEAEMRSRDPRYTARDVYWSAMNKVVLGALGRSDWQAAKMTYFEMALQAWSESDEDVAPERALDLQGQSDRLELMTILEGADAIRNGARDSRVSVIGCDCSVCTHGPHEGLWARDELAAPHIPHRGCRRDGWCACEYVAEFTG
jgi:hypothetical protein